jgi:hypothetical protein
VSEEFVTKQINKLNVKKATGLRERYFFYIKEIPELILDLQEISKNL